MRITKKLPLTLLTVIIFVQIDCSLMRQEQRKQGENLLTNNPIKNTGNLVFSIDCDKDQYLLGENIYLSFTLENKDTISFLVEDDFMVNAPSAPPSARRVYLHVTSPTNEDLGFTDFIEVGYPTKDLFASIGPGEKVHSHRYLLNESYRINSIGKYRVKGVYENYYGPELGFKNVWMGKVESQPIEFKVVEK